MNGVTSIVSNLSVGQGTAEMSIIKARSYSDVASAMAGARDGRCCEWLFGIGREICSQFTGQWPDALAAGPNFVNAPLHGVCARHRRVYPLPRTRVQ